ncbi:MAG: hypothetical protein ACLTK0_06490 [Anaerovoracaceae bacterium]
MKAFGIDGIYYGSQGAFNKTTVKMADACAYIFNMDPALAHTEEVSSKSGRDGRHGKRGC